MENSVLSHVIDYSVKNNVTDIHISEGKCPALRIDGELRKWNNLFVDMQKVPEQVISSLAASDRENIGKKWDSGYDIDCAFTFENKARLRCNLYRTYNGISAAFRIIPMKRLTAAQIGVPQSVINMCKNKGGLFIVTGPNGSGKTTTLASLIDVINESRNVHVLTIEDPIEYLYQDQNAIISQREIGQNVHSFYDALRSAVRENPDIVVLGEMRDLETTRIAIEMAETGHLVFATLHTRTAISSIDRLVGQFPAGEQNQIRLMLSENLIGVLAQMLLPKLNGGMIAVFELLLMNSAVRNAIRESKLSSIKSVMQTSHKIGMITMESAMQELIDKSIVSPSEMQRTQFDV